jgi:phytoene dehydrogenase-like protein
VGGRIKTDVVDGFRLDQGFQVLLYPEAKQLLDYDALQLKTFLPGATVLYDGGQFEIADPFRRPSVLLVGLHLLAH